MSLMKTEGIILRRIRLGETSKILTVLSPSDGKIRMVLYPPTRNAPETINVRFRHPQGKSIAKVLVDGKDWTDFDAKKELVKLSRTTEETEIVALY